MSYEVMFNEVQLVDESYPPTIDFVLLVKHDFIAGSPMLLKYALKFAGHTTYEFLESTTPTQADFSKSVRLTVDNHSFAAIAREVTSDPVKIEVEAALLSSSGLKLAQRTIVLEIDKDHWSSAKRRDNKPMPTGQVSRDHHTTMLADKAEDLRIEIANMKQTTLDDPFLQLQKKLLESQIGVMKTYFLQRPEMKQLQEFLPLMQICTDMKLDTKWAIAAALLASLEGYMKNWLVKNAGETLDEMKRKEFDELIAKIRAALITKKISFQQKKLSDLAGKRHLRNQVLHEMYVPSDDEIKEIRDETHEFVHYLDSLLM